MEFLQSKNWILFPGEVQLGSQIKPFLLIELVLLSFHSMRPSVLVFPAVCFMEAEWCHICWNRKCPMPPKPSLFSHWWSKELVIPRVCSGIKSYIAAQALKKTKIVGMILKTFPYFLIIEQTQESHSFLITENWILGITETVFLRIATQKTCPATVWRELTHFCQASICTRPCH